MQKIEYRAVVKFLTKQRKSAQTIMEEMASVYGDSCPGKTMIYKWHSLFKQGRDSLEHDPRRRKIMATIFWDSEGILLIDYKDKGVSITGEYYAPILERVKKLL